MDGYSDDVDMFDHIPQAAQHDFDMALISHEWERANKLLQQQPALLNKYMVSFEPFKAIFPHDDADAIIYMIPNMFRNIPNAAEHIRHSGDFDTALRSHNLPQVMSLLEREPRLLMVPFEIFIDSSNVEWMIPLVKFMFRTKPRYAEYILSLIHI